MASLEMMATDEIWDDLIERKDLIRHFWLQNDSFIGESAISPGEPCARSDALCLMVTINRTSQSPNRTVAVVSEEPCDTLLPFVCVAPSDVTPNDSSVYTCRCIHPFTGPTCLEEITNNQMGNEPRTNSATQTAPDVYECIDPMLLMLDGFNWIDGAYQYCLDDFADAEHFLNGSCQGLQKCNVSVVVDDPECLAFLELSFYCYWGSELSCDFKDGIELVTIKAVGEGWTRCLALIGTDKWDSAIDECGSINIGTIASEIVLKDNSTRLDLIKLIESQGLAQQDNSFFMAKFDGTCGQVVYSNNDLQMLSGSCNESNISKAICSLAPVVRDLGLPLTYSVYPVQNQTCIITNATTSDSTLSDTTNSPSVSSEVPSPTYSIWYLEEKFPKIYTKCKDQDSPDMYLCVLEQLTQSTQKEDFITVTSNPMLQDVIQVLENLWNELLSAFHSSINVNEMYALLVAIVSNLMELRNATAWPTDPDQWVQLIGRVLDLVERVGLRAAADLPVGNVSSITTATVGIALFHLSVTEVNYTFSILDQPLEAVQSDITVYSLPSTPFSAVFHRWNTLRELLPNTLRLREFYGRNLSTVPVGLALSVPDQSLDVILRLPTNGVSAYNSSSCVFFNTSNGAKNFYDDSGCKLHHVSEQYVSCRCEHLTTFAVLTDWNDVEVSGNAALEAITFVGCVLSIFCLLACIIAIALTKSPSSVRNTIHVNLCVCLLAGNVTLLVGSHHGGSYPVCVALAGLLHLTYLGAFTWMFLEGVNTLLTVVSVFTTFSKKRYYYLTGYGFPIATVAATMGSTLATGNDYIRSMDVCWLTSKNFVIWAFLGPAGIIILVNFVILMIALRRMQSLQVVKQQQLRGRIKKIMWGTIVLAPLLGVSWAFGFLFTGEETIAFAYIFTILNSLQGMFIFIFQFVMNKNLRVLIRQSRYFAKSRSQFNDSRLRTMTSCFATSSSTRTHSIRDSTAVFQHERLRHTTE